MATETASRRMKSVRRAGLILNYLRGRGPTVHFPPWIVCPECLSDDLSYTPLPHEGRLQSLTEVNGTTAMGMNDETLFVVGTVDLGSIRLSARIDDAEYNDLTIGDPMRLKIVDINGPEDQDRAFYRFIPD